MTAEKFKRKLTAILSADVKGYSRLMGADEEATLRTLQEYKEVMASSIQHHRGRIVGTAGDSVLAEFASVVDAVQCAVEIQQVLRAKNALLPEDRRMEFRIGINLGDVIEEGDTIYGDGVNIAARLEGLAEAGGICISESAYQQIENKLPLRYDYLGEHEVKNIAKPVRVYCARIESDAGPSKLGKEKKPVGKRLSKAVLAVLVLVVIAGAVILYQFVLRPSPSKTEVASKEKMAFPLPDKPSIAILAFTNMSGDPKEDFFGDGIAEEIITALSKSPKLFVIARNSTFVYKGKPVSIKQVAEELGVQYVLEGSFRKIDDKVRITAQLIDALSGHHLWAERYDRDLKDIFAVQDEITVKITSALNVKLTDGEIALMLGKSTKNLEAYLKLIQSREFMLQGNKENIALCRKLAEEAISLDPQCAMAYGLMASIYTYDVLLSTTQSPGESIAKGIEMAQKSIALDKNLAWPHGALVTLYVFKKDYDKALSEGEIALALEPNSALSYMFLGHGLYFSSRYDEAIAAYEKAIRLSPFPPSAVLFGLGVALRGVGRYGGGCGRFQEIASKMARRDRGLGISCSNLQHDGRGAEARAQAKEILGQT